MKNRIIAVDFGTCNTYMAQSVGGGPAEELNIVVGGDSAHGMKSVILYRTKGENVGINEFGQEAINAFGGASPKKKEANGYELATNFRPDIDVSEKARQDAICFLNKLLTEANNIDLSKADVIFSVPNEASESYRACLRYVARQAGWGNVRLLDEALGALCYIQGESSEDVAHEMFHDIVLVVNVDEGASGFAIIKDGNIKYSKSDMLMSGRLFDDLFYQWVIDCTQDSANPVTEKQLIQTGKDFYWRYLMCRELKENFMNVMFTGKERPYEAYFMDQYELELSWDEFVRRAQNYRPSQSFMNMTKFPAKTTLDPSRTTDIINWFEKEIRKAFEISHIPISSIGKVLLLDRSYIPFVHDTCQKIFGEEKQIRCTNPFAAISIGMIKYCRIKEATSN